MLNPIHFRPAMTSKGKPSKKTTLVYADDGRTVIGAIRAWGDLGYTAWTPDGQMAKFRSPRECRDGLIFKMEERAALIAGARKALQQPEEPKPKRQRKSRAKKVELS